MEIVYVFGVSIAIFLGMLLLLKKHKSKADYFLFAWLFVLASHLWLYYMEYSGLIINFPYLLGIIIPFPLLHGPFLYVYTRQIIKCNKNNQYNWLHFLPFFAMHLYLIQFYTLKTLEKLSIIGNHGIGYEGFLNVKSKLIFVSGMTYIIASLLLIKKHQVNLKNANSNMEKFNLTWLKYLICGLLVIWILVLSGNDEFVFVAGTVFVLLVGIFGIQKSYIFFNLPAKVELKETTNSEHTTGPKNTFNSRYENSGLDNEKKELIVQQLHILMNTEKVFLDPELSLSTLALKLNTQTNYVSQCLNEKFEMSFYEYINAERVKEFVRRTTLPEYKNLKLIAVAFDCGFNSKSTFNRAFKKTYGKTPSAFIKWRDGKVS